MIFRGAIYAMRALRGGRGHEQRTERPAVVIQSDQFATSTVTVAVVSSSAGPAIYRPEIELGGRRTRILTDQIYTVDPGRLGAFMGRLQPSELVELDQALMLKLGLV